MSQTSLKKRPAQPQRGPPRKRRKSEPDAYQEPPTKRSNQLSRTTSKNRLVPVTRIQTEPSDSGEDDNDELGPEAADETSPDGAPSRLKDPNGWLASDRRPLTDLTVFLQQPKSRIRSKKNFTRNVKPRNLMPKLLRRPNTSGQMRASSISPRRSGENILDSSWTSYAVRFRRSCSSTMPVALSRPCVELALRASGDN